MRRVRRQEPRSAMVWLAAGVVAGTALGWMTAPRRGDWLRNQIRQKLTHWERTGRRRLERGSRDVENRVRGSVAEVREAWSGRPHYVDANTLVDQVHSQIGREFGRVLEHVNLNAVDHTLYLHGFVESEIDRRSLVHAIRAVDGVCEVDDSELRVSAGQRFA